MRDAGVQRCRPRFISSGPGRLRPRAYVRTTPESYGKFSVLHNPAHHARPPQPKEDDHARCELNPTPTEPHALEQGKTDRSEAAAASKARLVDPDQAPDRGANPRAGDVQSRHRQQVARLR